MSFALDNSAMLAYMLATACSDTLLVHASVVRYEAAGMPSPDAAVVERVPTADFGCRIFLAPCSSTTTTL